MVESTQYDEKYHIFNKNSKNVCPKLDAQRDIRITTHDAYARNMQNKDRKTFEVKLKEYLGEDVPSSFNWKETL